MSEGQAEVLKPEPLVQKQKAERVKFKRSKGDKKLERKSKKLMKETIKGLKEFKKIRKELASIKTQLIYGVTAAY